MLKKICIVAILFLGFLTMSLEAQPPKGRKEATLYQNFVAQALKLKFLRSPSEVWDAIEKGLLVPLLGNENYRLFEVSYPYVLPETKEWTEEFARSYRNVCGAQLVVTSAVRPIEEQPWNASPVSVHPTGMAVDLRVPPKKDGCIGWFLDSLNQRKKGHTLDFYPESFPPHYHVAVFRQRR